MNSNFSPKPAMWLFYMFFCQNPLFTNLLRGSGTADKGRPHGALHQEQNSRFFCRNKKMEQNDHQWGIKVIIAACMIMAACMITDYPYISIPFFCLFKVCWLAFVDEQFYKHCSLLSDITFPNEPNEWWIPRSTLRWTRISRQSFCGCTKWTKSEVRFKCIFFFLKNKVHLSPTMFFFEII